MNKPSEADHSIVIIVRGIPGSGKSCLATALEQSIGPDQVVMLDPDATDYHSREYLAHVKALTAEGVDPALYAYRFLRAKAYRGIAEHKTVIWNQPFTNVEIFKKMIDRLETHATEHDSRLSILIVEVMLDPVLAKERVVARKRAGGHGPSEATLNRRISDYKSFADLGFRTVTVDGEADPAVSVSIILEVLKDLA